MKRKITPVIINTGKFENPFFRKYNNLPEATETALRGGLYHTDDLGRKLLDGNYIIASRMNDMIKINKKAGESRLPFLYSISFPAIRREPAEFSVL